MEMLTVLPQTLGSWFPCTRFPSLKSLVTERYRLLSHFGVGSHLQAAMPATLGPCQNKAPDATKAL